MNRALVYLEWGELGSAISFLENCLSLSVVEYDLLDLLVSCYMAQECTDEARHLAVYTLMLYPGSVGMQRYLAKMFYEAGDSQSALAYCELSRSGDPHEIKTLLLLAEIYISVSRHDDATRILTRLLSMHHSRISVYSLLWRLHQETRQHDKELETLVRLESLQPGNIEVKLRMAQLLITIRDRAKSGVLILRRIQKNKEYGIPIARLLAEGYSKLGLQQKAQFYYWKVIRSNERMDSDIINLVVSFFDCGDLQTCEALIVRFRASVFSSTFRYNQGLIAIARGNLSVGWPLLDWRWTSDYLRQYQYARILENVPKWEGESLHGKTLLILGEQGLGEEILFAGLIPELSGKTKSILLVGNARLKGVFVNSLSDVQFIERDSIGDQWEKIKTADVWCFGGTIARYTRRCVRAFQASRPYIGVRKIERDGFRKNYDEMAKGRPIVGISFASIGSGYSNRKSPPNYLWIELLKGLPFFFVNLQYGPEERVSALNDALESNCVEFYRDRTVNPNETLIDQANQIAALDFVISVSNTTAHLAAGIGIRTYVLLPYSIALIWTLPYGRVSLWYPTVTFVRQEKPGCWRGAFIDIMRLCLAFRNLPTVSCSGHTSLQYSRKV